VSTRPTQIRHEFTNAYGERWLLRIDRQTETGELTGDDLGDMAVQITNDVIQSDLILGADESAWLAECWEVAIGRPLRPSPFQRFVALMSAISKGSHDQD